MTSSPPAARPRTLVRGLGRVGLLVAALSAVGLTAPAAGEAAPTPSHVAVVIAGQGSYCTAWHPGMTGADALQAVATVTWGTGPYAGGFVIGINGVVTNPTQKYWSYWHGSGGGWSFSGIGVTGYQVPAGGLEVWSISVTNGALTPPPPASYAGVCAGADVPPAPPPRPPATTAPAHPAASTPRPAPAPVGPATSAAGRATTRAPGPATTNDAGTAGAGPAGGHLTSASGQVVAHGPSRAQAPRTPNGTSRAASSRTSAGAIISGSASATSGPTVVDASPASQATSPGAGSPLPLIVGGGLGLLLLAAAGGYAWRRSRTG